MSDKDKRFRQEHFVGASSEHYAAAMFLANSWQVYWPAVQQDAVDFVIYDQHKFQRVQVKRATWNRSGKNKYLQCRIKGTKKYNNIRPSDLYDLLVIVAPDGRLWLIPANKLASSNICLDSTGRHGSTRYSWRKYLWHHLAYNVSDVYMEDIIKAH